MKRVNARDTCQTELKEGENISELSGKLGTENKENKLMKSVLENDKDAIDDGKLISDAINQGLNSLSPDLMFEQIVKNYSIANQIYGPSLIRLISGYNPDYVKKNINIPEFRKELKRRLKENIEKLKDKDLLDNDNCISEDGVTLASLVTYFEELDKLIPKGILGGREYRKTSIYGGKGGVREFKNGDRYRDIALKKSIKLAIRRNHKKLLVDDLKVFERESKGQCYIIYGLDASGSMKGKKLGACKRAGIALAYKAIEEKDKVGLIAFGSEVKESVLPTNDFSMLLREIVRIKASRQTDIVSTIRKSIDMFPNEDITKHLILITDALPNIGENPEKKTLQEISLAKDKGITISLIGIKLDKKGKELAKKIVELGQGRLYVVNNVEDVDKVVLEDYYWYST